MQKKVGPAWTERGRSPAGYFTKRTAEGWLRDRLDEARRGGLPGGAHSGATFAEAATEWLRYIEHDRKRKPSTVEGYASIVRPQLLPTFGAMAIESITPAAIERWLASLEQASSSRTKSLVLLHGIFQRARKVWGLAVNPVADVEKPPLERSGDIEVFSPEEVWALVRAAGSERDGALYLTAAFTGLRMGELLALRWRDIDWTAGRIRVRRNFVRGEYGTPKSKRSTRSVPLADRVAGELDLHFQRSAYTGDDDLAFAHPETGRPLDRSRLLKRFKRTLRRAGARELRFHDLRHTFGTRCAAAGVPLRTIQEWMGHRDFKTTLIYADYAPSHHEAEMIERAFSAANAGGGGQASSDSTRSPLVTSGPDPLRPRADGPGQ